MRPSKAMTVAGKSVRYLASSRHKDGILDLARSSAILFGGAAVARVLGLLFAIVAARLLLPAAFGDFSYAITVAGIIATLVSAAPVGLSRFLSRHEGDLPHQSIYFSNWLVTLAFVIVGSLIIGTPAVVFFARLSGGMLAGVAVNVVGVAVLQFYLEARRGISSYALLTTFWVLANLVQLVGIIVVYALGYASPAVFVAVYALSSVVALAIIQPLAPFPVPFSLRLVTRARVFEVMNFASPILLQSVFYGVWFGFDLVAVQRLQSPTATGEYAAAKTIASGLLLVPWSIGMVVLPRAARLPTRALGRSLVEVLGVTSLAAVPLTALVIWLAPTLVDILFTGRYARAAEPLAVLAVGGLLFAYSAVLGNFWVGRGHPGIATVATGAAMVTTIVTALLLVPTHGTAGAAIAFTTGAGLRLLVIAWLIRGLLETSRDVDAIHVEPSPMAVVDM